MKILVADKFPQTAVDLMIQVGCEVIYDPGLKNESLVEALKKEKPQGVVVRSTKVPKDAILADPNLALIIRAGAGYNNIDVTAASDGGIYVANCPGKNAVAVAELAMGHIMSLDRRIPDNVADLRSGKWNKQEYSKAEGLYGKTLGIIGTGRIGQELISRAKAFGMNVIAWSRSLNDEKAAEFGVSCCENISEVAQGSDFISLHLALTDDTRGMINEAFFSKMKDGACLINTSRAEIVDDDALLSALNSRNIRVGIDVYSDEPAAKEGAYSNALTSHPGVYGTHHIGASTNQAQLAVADETVRIIRTYMDSGEVLNCVNLMAKTPARYVLSVRHLNRVGVLASVLNIVSEEGINVERMENIIFSGANGSCANIQIDDSLPESTLKAIHDSDEAVLEVNQSELT